MERTTSSGGLELTPERSSLTERQQAIVELIASGCTDKEVAAHLGMSTSTVHTHLARLFKRFRVHTRAALVSVWLSADHSVSPV
jgi:DNA-binding NarL/FixJ family response regulator